MYSFCSSHWYAAGSAYLELPNADLVQAYISIALDGTGALEAIAFWVSQKGGSSGLRLFTYLYTFFLGVGCIVGNDPLILSGTPVCTGATL